MTIQAAVERLRAHEAAMQTKRGRDIPEYLGEKESLVRDLADTSREYLRLTDPTPITPDLLKRLGFKEIEFGYLECGLMLAASDASEWFIRQKPDRLMPWQIYPRTLGELRSLANRLGVPLKETE